MKQIAIFVIYQISFLILSSPVCLAEEGRLVTDAAGRIVKIPGKTTRVICSGSGCLRLLTYVGAQDKVVAVDSIELRGSPIDARPYAIANPEFKNYPLFGEFRGYDNPELIAALDLKPEVIFKIVSGQGQDPDLLQAKTGIAVVVLDYGNLTYGRERLNFSLRLIGEIIGKKRRVEEVIAFFDFMEEDLKKRTEDIPEDKRPACYIGGLGQRGPQGFLSTDPSFAPFVFTEAKNVASQGIESRRFSHIVVAKEQIILWDPEVIFLDISTLRSGARANALEQLRTDSSYKSIRAVSSGRVYGLFPNMSYNQNFDAVFANAYFVGKTLYPERFADIEPIAKAEEISLFLNGAVSFEQLNQQFKGLAFERINIR